MINFKYRYETAPIRSTISHIFQWNEFFWTTRKPKPKHISSSSPILHRPLIRQLSITFHSSPRFSYSTRTTLPPSLPPPVFHPGMHSFSPPQQIKLIETAIFSLPSIFRLHPTPPSLPRPLTCSLLLILARSLVVSSHQPALWSTFPPFARENRFIPPSSPKKRRNSRRSSRLNEWKAKSDGAIHRENSPNKRRNVPISISKRNENSNIRIPGRKDWFSIFPFSLSPFFPPDFLPSARWKWFRGRFGGFSSVGDWWIDACLPPGRHVDRFLDKATCP